MCLLEDYCTNFLKINFSSKLFVAIVKINVNFLSFLFSIDMGCMDCKATKCMEGMDSCI